LPAQATTPQAERKAVKDETNTETIVQNWSRLDAFSLGRVVQGDILAAWKSGH
jgi:hypothetical protein